MNKDTQASHSSLQIFCSNEQPIKTHFVSLYKSTVNTASDDIIKEIEIYFSNKEFIKLLEIYIAKFSNIIEYKERDYVDSFYSLALYLLQRIPDKKLQDTVQNFVNTITNEDNYIETRIQMLELLFNALPTFGKQRYIVFLALLKYALRVNATSLVPFKFDNIAHMTDDWNIPQSDVATILLLLAKVCEANNMVQLRREYIYKYLSTWNRRRGEEVC